MALKNIYKLVENSKWREQIFSKMMMIDYLIHDSFFSQCSQEWLLNFSKTKHKLWLKGYLRNSLLSKTKSFNLLLMTFLKTYSKKLLISVGIGLTNKVMRMSFRRSCKMMLSCKMFSAMNLRSCSWMQKCKIPGQLIKSHGITLKTGLF